MSEPVNWLGGCAEVLALYGLKAQCCGSCHSDEEYGYPSYTDYKANGGIYEICCGTRAALRESGRSEDGADESTTPADAGRGEG